MSRFSWASSAAGRRSRSNCRHPRQTRWTAPASWSGAGRAATTLYRDQSFDAALGEYLRSEAAVLPVAADELEPRFLGTVSRQDLLLAL